jgi:hypothetical protein
MKLALEVSWSLAVEVAPHSRRDEITKRKSPLGEGFVMIQL